MELMRYIVRRGGKCLLGGSDGISKPAYGLSEVIHVAHGLCVFKHISLVEAHAQVPVDRTRHDHRGQEEHVVYGVENVGRSTAPDGDDCRSDLSPQRPAVGQGDEAGARGVLQWRGPRAPAALALGEYLPAPRRRPR